MNDRRNSQPKDVLCFGPFSLYAAERLLTKADEPIALGGRALDILIALAERAGEVVTQKELVSTVWPGVTVEKGNLRFQMVALRSRPPHIEAILVARYDAWYGTKKQRRFHAGPSRYVGVRLPT